MTHDVAPEVASTVGTTVTTNCDPVALENMPGPVAEFVRESGGHTLITKVLIANNGIAAVKEIQSVRKWAYEQFGDERAIEFTVMATPEDLRVNAEYIRMADQYVEVPGGSNNNNYANVDVVVDVAERTGVHAVWAGWGHASENPRLPEMLSASTRKIVFIGPPGSAMRSLGDKISSTIVAQSADVPTLSWSGDGITGTARDANDHVTVPDEIYRSATITSCEQGLESAHKIGFPVMIKASEGGGGKGIRRVDSVAAFAMAYEQVRGEVPGSPIFIMKLADAARHLEVQVLADQHGNAISLFGRDCSVQRRHQKIIEEAPVTVASPEVFEQMEQAAIRLAKLVGYVSAGTVEYLYAPETQQYYFLELNPRLQVEHPTTEMVSGVNLPAAQLQVAMGIPLNRIRDVRLLYGVAPHGTSEIDFDGTSALAAETQRRPCPRGHVTAVRITAENPDAGFKPSSGMVHELNFRSSTNVWGYFSVAGGGGGLHEYADSQFGHIFAYGENRAQSRKNMIMALRQLSIRSDFRTTVEYLIRLLETDDFASNRIDTGWLDSLISSQLTPDRPDPILSVLCGAVHRAHTVFSERRADFHRALERGQQPSADLLRTEYTDDIILDGVKFRFTASAASRDTYMIYINGRGVEVGVRPLSDGGMLVLADGRSHTMYWREEVQATRVMIDGRTCMLEQESDPTQLRSPSPGKLVRYLVAPGDALRAGDAYAEVEVMKMYMPLVVTEDGTVQFIRPAGSTLSPGDVIGILTLADPSRVKHARPFDGQLPELGPANVHGDKAHQRLREARSVLERLLDGYDQPGSVQHGVEQFARLAADRQVPFYEFAEVMSTLHGRLPGQLEADLTRIVDAAAQRRVTTANHVVVFPAAQLRAAIDRAQAEWPSSLQPDAIASLNSSAIAPLLEVIDTYAQGVRGFRINSLINLLERYHGVESLFDEADRRDEETILALRDQHKDNLDHVVALVLSHSRVSSKNRLMLALFDLIMPDRDSGALPDAYQPIFRRLAELKNIRVAKVAIRARELLIRGQLPSYEERRQQMEHILRSATTDTIYGAGIEYRTPNYEAMKDLVGTNFYVFDVLRQFFFHATPWIRLAALEVYARRAYHAYDVSRVTYRTDPTMPFAVLWQFWRRQYHDVSSTGGVVDVVTDEDASAGQPHHGVMVAFQAFDDIAADLSTILGYLPTCDRNVPTNIVNIAAPIPTGDTDTGDDEFWIARCRRVLDATSEQLRAAGVRRVTFVLIHHEQQSGVYTFRAREDFAEDQRIRHLDPGLAYQLELRRLSNFELNPCFLSNRGLHIYHAVGRENSADSRFFIRALVRPGRVRTSQQTTDYLISESDRLLNDILDALEVVSSTRPNSDCNHLFISFIPTFVLDAVEVETALTSFIERHGTRLWRLHVTGGEIRFIVQTSPNGPAIPIRFCISTISGYVIKVDIYMEKRKLDGTWIFSSINEPGALHLHRIDEPYRPKEWLQPKRYKAHIMGTTYVYDFPELFQQEIRQRWERLIKLHAHVKMPSELLRVSELVLDEHNEQMQEVCRPPGTNDCGMVAWRFTMFTPEYPEGRQAIVIANDITFQSGSFAVSEDRVFYRASELARATGLPRIYLSANSGARIGLAEEILALVQVAWTDPQDPSQGFDYLYLTDDDYRQLRQRRSSTTALNTPTASNQLSDAVITEPIEVDGTQRYRITDIVGLVDGLGVENLRGSGMIAGATSRAYDDIFTISLVTCRSVGIGAYLVRLGQRVIQNQGQPIILTGASALNKVLGREVYASNLQLGGTQIMHKNGVAHLVAEHDLHGINRILRWMSYVPARRNAPLPIWPYLDDPVDRDVEVTPAGSSHDPRQFMAGMLGEADEQGAEQWLPGFFDRGTFMETLAGWARSVVVGRARLGGIPVGVIAVEARTVERVIPADPANADSEEQLQNEAGQVWYPNSAYKTAQAIRDFNAGEQLPLIIFANWRGFSGGQRDMFNEVLKYGSFIVDALVAYKQPIFVYVIPNGELRGGAWVVLDPTINPDYMEMYADETSRAGVLEPEGIVDVKFRRKQMLSVMTRLDATYRQLKQQLDDPTLPVAQRASLKERLDMRERELEPVYRRVALQFADLHDTPGRMLAKGVIRRVLRWRNARRFFYWRLRRRLAEERAYAALHAADPQRTRAEQQASLQQEILASVLSTAVDAPVDDAQDVTVAEWLESTTGQQAITTYCDQLRAARVRQQTAVLVREDQVAAVQGLADAIKAMSTADQQALFKQLGVRDLSSAAAATTTTVKSGSTRRK